MELTQKLIRMDDQAYELYARRVHDAGVKMDALGRGARIRCAGELRTNPAAVSNVLNLRLVSVRVLGKIEAWLEQQV